MKRVFGFILVGWPFPAILAGMVYSEGWAAMLAVVVAVAILFATIFAGVALIMSEE